MKKITYLFIGIFVLLLVMVLVSLTVPPSEYSHAKFEKYKYDYQIEGPEDVKDLFDNFKFNNTDKISTSKFFPVVNKGEFYNYLYYYSKICSASGRYCSDEKEENKTFHIINVTENNIKYSVSSASSDTEETKEIVFPKSDFEGDISDYVEGHTECQKFICEWFLYVNENLSYGLKIKINKTDDELKNLKDEIFDEYILIVNGTENVNGRECFKVEIYKKELDGIHTIGSGIPFLFFNYSVTLEFKISKEIFWVDAEKRMLVKMQRLENNTIIKEVNLINTINTINTNKF